MIFFVFWLAFILIDKSGIKFFLDPTPFLFVSFEMKKEDSLKPYDAKKSVWVPDGEGGFDEALIAEVGYQESCTGYFRNVGVPSIPRLMPIFCKRTTSAQY